MRVQGGEKTKETEDNRDRKEGKRGDSLEGEERVSREAEGVCRNRAKEEQSKR